MKEDVKLMDSWDFDNMRWKLFCFPREEFGGELRYNLIGIENSGIRRVDHWFGYQFRPELSNYELFNMIAFIPTKSKRIMKRLINKYQ
jgi:hypothetical protein